MGQFSIRLLVDSLDKMNFDIVKKKIADDYVQKLKSFNSEHSLANSMIEILFGKNHSKKITKEELGIILEASFREITHDTKCISQYMFVLKELLVDRNDNKLHGLDKRTEKYIQYLEDHFYSIATNETKFFVAKNDDEVLDFMVDYLRIILAMYPNRILQIDKEGNKVYGISKMDFDIDLNDTFQFLNEIFAINRKIDKKKGGFFPWDKQAHIKDIQLVFSSLVSWLLFIKLTQDEGFELKM